MSALSDLRERLALQLADGKELVFSTDEMDEFLRGSLEYIGWVYHDKLTIEGLDGAEQTTLVDNDIPLLLYGASWFASKVLVLRCFNTFGTDLREDAALLGVYADRRAEFEVRLDELRVANLQGAPDAPISKWDKREVYVWEEGGL